MYLSKQDIFVRLKRLDLRVAAEFDDYDGRFVLVIVGGGALVLHDYISRVTRDIDVLQAAPSLYEFMEQYDINGRVNAHIFSFLYNFPDRVVLVWSGLKIDYYTASLEDIVIAKICANRDNDWDDLRMIHSFINWDVLDRLVHDEEELSTLKMSDHLYSSFVFNYEIFERRYRSCKK